MSAQTIEQLIAEGRAKVEVAKLAKLEQEKRENEEARARADAAWARFEAEVKAALPEVVHPFIDMRRPMNKPCQEPGYYDMAVLRVPGCDLITLILNDRDGMKYHVAKAKHMKLEYESFGIDLGWRVEAGESWVSEDLPMVLAAAEVAYHRRQELQADADQRNSDEEQRLIDRLAVKAEADERLERDIAKTEAEAQRQEPTWMQFAVWAEGAAGAEEAGIGTAGIIYGLLAIAYRLDLIMEVNANTRNV